jgi:hypothetical protein
MASPEFARLSFRIWEALRDEAIAAMGVGAMSGGHSGLGPRMNGEARERGDRA